MIAFLSRWAWILGIVVGLVIFAVAVFGQEGSGVQREGEEEAKAKEVKLEPAELNTAALMALRGAGIPFILLDARGSGSKMRRIPGAKPLSPRKSAEWIVSQVPTKSSLIVTYCGGPHCALSSRLAVRLKKLGYKNVIEYPGGIQEWIKGGNKFQVYRHKVSEDGDNRRKAPASE
ncbi:MAG: rhodanese-like domain-containing protein [Planctomycetota bacterium]|jgi:rhodanese-related sulfurtransferase